MVPILDTTIGLSSVMVFHMFSLIELLKKDSLKVSDNSEIESYLINTVRFSFFFLEL